MKIMFECIYFNFSSRGGYLNEIVFVFISYEVTGSRYGLLFGMELS